MLSSEPRCSPAVFPGRSNFFKLHVRGHYMPLVFDLRTITLAGKCYYVYLVNADPLPNRQWKNTHPNAFMFAYREPIGN